MTLSENHHLIFSNRGKCKELIEKFQSAGGIDESDLIDFFISLHIVLEVGINSFFRYIYRAQSESWIEKKSSFSAVDKIGFREKVVTFIYGGDFSFNTEAEKIEAKKHLKIIGHIMNFCKIRNNLLHGHSISTEFFSDESVKHSDLRKDDINLQKLIDHIEMFIKIKKGLAFFYRHWHPSLSPPLRDSNIKEFLDVSFLEGYKIIN